MCYSLLVKNDLRFIGDRFRATVDEPAFAELARRGASNPKKFKLISEHPRIYPNYWAPIVIARGSERLIEPMRYRVLPSWSRDEIPTKYNLFNARLDQLDQRRTWKGTFMRHHGLLVFERFYEWVKPPGATKPVVISFAPRDREAMWTPVLYDIWQSPDGADRLLSFAVITTDPPPEVLEQGHDRCPVFLREDHIETWLHPQGRSKAEMLRILQQIEPVYYECAVN